MNNLLTFSKLLDQLKPGICCGITIFLFTLMLPAPAFADSFADHFHMANPQLKIAPFVYEDQNGVQRALADARGKYILLNIWATWCAPCVKEMPSLDALQVHFNPNKLLILPISEDRGDAVVQTFYQNHALRHLPVAIDLSGIAPSILQLHGLPTTLLVGPQGNEIGRIEGNADWTSPDTIAFLNTLIL